jgi:hypothetical protein
MKVTMNDDFTFSECVQLSDPKIKLLLSIRFGKYGEEDPSVELVRKSKVGKIQIRKTSENPGYLNKGGWFSGITANFGEGMGVYISDTTEWFTTSTIQEIDWENNRFYTLNSTYEFQFEEIDEQTLNKIYNYYESTSNQ